MDTRKFSTGATRDADVDKYDYEGFLSPRVVERFGKYMHQHRKQSDGELRDSDNWQRGIPLSQYIKSLFRHFLDLWKLHRGMLAFDNRGPVDVENACCGILFNVSGYLHEYLKGQQAAQQTCQAKTVGLANSNESEVINVDQKDGSRY